MFSMYGFSSKPYLIVCVPMLIVLWIYFCFFSFESVLLQNFWYCFFVVLTRSQESENKNSFLRWETVPPLTQTRQEARGERWASSCRLPASVPRMMWGADGLGENTGRFGLSWVAHQMLALLCSPAALPKGGRGRPRAPLMTRVPPLAGC